MKGVTPMPVPEPKSHSHFGLLLCTYVDGISITAVNQNYVNCFNTSYEDILGNTFLPLILKDDQALITDKLKNIGGINKTSFIVDHRCVVNSEIKNFRWLDVKIENNSECGLFKEYFSAGYDIEDPNAQRYHEFLRHVKMIHRIYQVYDEYENAFSFVKDFVDYNSILAFSKVVGITCVEDKTIKYAMAFTEKHWGKKRAVVLFNPNYPKFIKIKMLLHEIAHHLLGHTDQNNRLWFPISYSEQSSYIEDEANWFANIIMVNTATVFNLYMNGELTVENLMGIMDREENIRSYDNETIEMLKSVCKSRIDNFNNGVVISDFLYRYFGTNRRIPLLSSKKPCILWVKAINKAIYKMRKEHPEKYITT